MNNSLYAGGAEKILQTLLRHLDPQVYNITLYGLKKEEFDSQIFPSHIAYNYIFDQDLGDKGFFGSLWMRIVNKSKLLIYDHFSPKLFYKLFVRGKYDVEVAFIEGYSTKIISGSSNPKSIKVAWVHADLHMNHWTAIAYKNIKQEKKCYQQFDHIVSVSESVQNAFSRKFEITDKLKVKYNPVNRNEILEKSKQPIDIQEKQRLRLITVGRLEHQKGYDRLLVITKKLLEEGFNFELWIIGEGIERENLEKYIQDSQLEDRVTLFGFQKNPYQFVQASDVFVCSSRSEGFSTVVTEALILGMPVLSTNCSGMKELLGDNEYGVITKNNEEDLYKGLKQILEDESLRAHYRKKSKERSKDFDIEATIAQIEMMWAYE
ncbi:glycosyltransferase [Aquimarina gracilis]|uniref:Glycosyltransferase n=1 Tax=Aquimarina gracilis TaxID=874422 RepID=A0ABU6A249_9FLAO|nr:glycosyltransferase [Aquimarina gracilis]MEB3348182.1 glycosyltransferase [Aquimarina gracilis]